MESSKSSFINILEENKSPRMISKLILNTFSKKAFESIVNMSKNTFLQFGAIEVQHGRT